LSSQILGQAKAAIEAPILSENKRCEFGMLPLCANEVGLAI
jgi:hypothetical protein